MSWMEGDSCWTLGDIYRVSCLLLSGHDVNKIGITACDIFSEKTFHPTRCSWAWRKGSLDIG